MTLHNVNGVSSSPLKVSGLDEGDGVTPVTVVMWPCDECGAQFTRQSKLERHRLSHSTPRIIVVTPSGLRLTAQQVTLHDSDDLPTSAISQASSDNSLVYIGSSDD